MTQYGKHNNDWTHFIDKKISRAKHFHFDLFYIYSFTYSQKKCTYDEC